jgi:hypothetical protein
MSPALPIAIPPEIGSRTEDAATELGGRPPPATVEMVYCCASRVEAHRIAMKIVVIFVLINKLFTGAPENADAASLSS